VVKADQLAQAFGRVLRERRLAAGLSQEKLALEADVDRTFVSLLERGGRQPTLSTLWRLAGALGIGPSELIGAVERQQKSGRRQS
jgi:transcriptional regulator with XRE-family HTH domain